MISRVLAAAAVVAAVAIAAIVAHVALIEIGQEVATLRIEIGGGAWYQTRLWIVDDGEVAWLHSAGDTWRRRFDGDPIVEVARPSGMARYRAHAEPGPHPHLDELLRQKYGWVDRWVRLLAPCDDDTVPVRLARLTD